MSSSRESAIVDEVIDRTARLVSIPSVSAVQPAFDQSNERIIDELTLWFDQIGFETLKIPVPGVPGKFNFMASLGQGDGGLVLSGHTDTVPCDAKLWASDPFTLTKHDGGLVGLGVADMKSFFAFAFIAARTQRDAIKRPLVVLGTADEESGMDGAKALVRSSVTLPRLALIGEPTSFVPIVAHKGVSFERLVIRGRSGHSSRPELGLNAIEAMVVALSVLKKHREQLVVEKSDLRFVPPHTTLNFGAIAGGDNPNRICGECELLFDVRPVPGTDLLALRSSIQHQLQNHPELSGFELSLAPMHEPVPPYAISDGAQTFVHGLELMTGQKSAGVSFGTEAPYLQQLGAQSVILGPGSIDVAHQPNERLEITRLAEYQELVSSLVAKHCIN